jgi:hypothetical protein
MVRYVKANGKDKKGWDFGNAGVLFDKWAAHGRDASTPLRMTT